MTRTTLHLALWTGLYQVGTMPLVWALWGMLATQGADVTFDFPAPLRAGETRAAAFTLDYPETLLIQYRAAKGDVRDEQRCDPHPMLWWQTWTCANARFAPALSWEVRTGGRVVARGTQRGPLRSAQEEKSEAIAFSTREIVPHSTTRFELRVTALNDLAPLGARQARVIVSTPPMLGDNKAWLLFGAGMVVLFVIGVPLVAMASNARMPTLRRR